MSSDARRRISITSISSQLQPRSRPASPSLSVASSTNSGSPSRKRLTSFRNTLRRVSSVGGSSSRGSGRNVVHPLPNEKPVAILRVRILGCKNLTAADWNGKSDPYVSVTFARQKFKTPVISRNLNPIYQPKDATFDFPIYSSVVEKIGANIEVIVWDKDVVGKDYLGEVSIPYNDWAAHSGRGPTSISYLDKGNSTFWMDLVSTKEKKTASGSVHMKIGLAQPADNPRPLDFPHVYTDLQRHVAAAGLNPLTASPTQGYGTYDSEQNTIPFNVGKADMDDERETEEQALRDRGSPVPENLALPPPPPLTMPTFSIVWKGTRVEYSFSKGKEILGIVMLDIHNAEDLPKSNSAQRGGWDMDPYLMINYGSKTFRTRVVRHSLSPTWDEKILFHVLRADADTVDPTSPHPQNTTVHFKLLDWDKNTTDDIVGDTEFDFAELIAAAPLPDETTGLYPEESVESRNSMKDVRLPLIIAKDVGLETRHAPYLNIRARYEPHAVFRQRFWRTQLVQFDVDKSGTFSRSEIIALLADLGLALDKAVLADFFTRFGKDMEKDDLEFEEALMCLEEELGLRPSVKPERLSRAPTGVSGKAEGETASVPTSAPTMESERVPSPDVQPSAAKEELQAVGLEPAFEEAPRPAPKPSPSGYMSDESEGEVENAIPDTIIEDQEEPAEHPAPAAGTPELVEPDGFPWSKPSAEEPASQEDPWFTSPTEGEALTPASEVPLPASPSLSAERPGSPYAPGTPLRGSSASLPAPPSPSIVVTDDEKSEPIFPPQHRSPASTHGRSSTSLTNLRTQLTSIFAEHPESKVDPTTNAPTLPVGAITAVLGRFSARYDVQLLNPGEEEQLNAFTARFTDMTITPDSLMELIAKMTGAQQGAAVEEKETQPQPQPEVQVETEAENEKAGGEDEKDRLGVPGAREGGLLYLGSESVSSSNVSVYHSEALEHEGHETGGSEESLPTHPDFALDTPLEGAHDPLLDPAGAFSPPESTDAGTEVPMDISELDGLYAHADEEEEDVEVPHIQPTPAEHMHIPLDIEERISELNTTNADLQRQLKEVEERTHRTIAEQEAQLEEGQIRIEELRAEVLASRREAKEMKGKERNYVQQVTSLESELAKLERALETSRASTASMQKLYSEQCQESEKYRNSLRKKDQEFKNVEDEVSRAANEAAKWKSLCEASEASILALQTELDSALHTQQIVEEQKQENDLLKETIDRLHADLDELRAAHSAALAANKTHSAQESLTKSLARELAVRLKEVPVSGASEDEADGDVTVVDEEEDEEFVETVITASLRKKTGGRASKKDIIRVEEVTREYIDASTQHEFPPNTSIATVQTESEPVPVVETISIQTDEVVPPVIDVTELGTQTEEPPRPASPIRLTAEIQTDAPIEEAPPSPEPSTSRTIHGDLIDDEDLASSTTTVRPLSPSSEDLPSYVRLEDEQKEKIGLAVLAKWHPGMRSTAPLPNGVSREAVEGWETLKTELGFECMAIDKVVQGSTVREPEPQEAPAPVAAVAKAKELSKRRWMPSLTLTLGICGVCAMVLALSARRSTFFRLGGPSYRDRRLWNLYNTLAGPSLEGFHGRAPSFGMLDSIWHFAERLFAGGAQMRRVPT